MIVPVVDLRAQLHPIRRQGLRPTCLAFAASSAHEVKIAAPGPLCVEYLFFNAAARMPAGADGGLTMTATADALVAEGQPNEDAWPYTLQAVDHWTPPSISPPFHKSSLTPGSTDFDWIVDSLNQGRPVILGLILTNAFFWPDSLGVVDDGNFAVERGGHAVLAVGHGSVGTGQPALLVRNSWGDRWGLKGHAWLPRSYLSRQLHETAILT